SAASGIGDEAHQRHLAVGMSAQEGCQVFDAAMTAQLPQLLISTTDLNTARQFYPARHSGAGLTLVDTAPAVAAETGLPERLHGCLCKWLGVSALDPDDSLYELGADSLTLLDLIDELQAATGVVFQLSQFSHKVSLREVLALVQSAQGGAAAVEDQWTDAVRIDQWHAGADRERLYLIHPVGGDVQAYRELASALHPDLGVWVIADPALRLPELPNISLAERAQLYLDALQAHHPDGTAWRLAGWSFGAWVAQAMCNLLADGCEQPLLYLIDPPAPDAGTELARIDEEHIQQVFQREFSARRALNTAASTASEDASRYLQSLIVCCQNNMASMADHRPAQLIDTRARLFIATRPNPYGMGSAWQMADLQRAWQDLLPHLLSWQPLDTDHYGIVAAPWAQLIAEMINADLPAGEG
ncbi:thioesterase domain-containing protein, partial [Pseudomonas savastanoi]|uniref:thioesterase domain-containing protein n=1 Tax=Pseudomonas savastanoi TaxID=29438 RepID=UPI001F349107